MSKPALLTILALAIASAIYFAALAFYNGKLVDDAIRRELLKPDCVSIPYAAEDRGRQCYVKDDKA